MSDPFIGEVQILGFSFAPKFWATASGQMIPIRQNTALYALYGMTFGGDGQTNFALPNLASRQACGAGQSPGNSPRDMGQTFGAAEVALMQNQMPAHNHGLSAFSTFDSAELVAMPTPAAAIGNTSGEFRPFAPPGTTVAMNANAIGMSGNGSPHENRQPFLGLTYAVALVGVFPTFN